MSTPKKPCAAIRPWLKANLGPQCLGVLTGTDSRALDAAVQIVELYAYGESAEAIRAFGLVVTCMQPTARELAYHSIAYVLDWPDRARLWVAAGLPEFAPRCCLNEHR